MSFTKVAPAGIGTEPGDGYRIGNSFLHSTGLNVSGIITATEGGTVAYYGDGSNLTGIDATAIKHTDGNVKVQATGTGANLTGNLTVSGNLGVGGVVTYEDVTNIDSVGVITARSGLNVVGNDLNVGSNIKLGNASGIVTATSFSGSGASLTNLPAAQLSGTAAAINGSNITNLNASNIASGTVPTARLGSGTANNTTFLRGDSTFQTVNTDLVSDTSPQLGGNLDVNTKNINFGDSSGSSDDRLNFGADTDLSIYHNGTNNIISSNTSGKQLIMSANSEVRLTGTTTRIMDENNSETCAIFASDGAVELYHDNALRLDTTTGGADIRSSGSAVEMKLRTSGGTTRGWVYANDANQVGFLDEGGNWAIMHYNDNYTQFRITNATKARIDGDGLKFGTDTAAANALDDYEEGSWTPAYSRPNMTITNANQVGKYVKIGRVVHIVGKLNSTNEQGSSSGGPILVTGLPFTVREVRCALSVRPASWSHDHPSFATFELNQTHFELLEEVEGNPSGSSDLTGTRFAGGTGNYLWFSGSYFTDT